MRGIAMHFVPTSYTHSICVTIIGYQSKYNKVNCLSNSSITEMYETHASFEDKIMRWRRPAVIDYKMRKFHGTEINQTGSEISSEGATESKE